MKQRKSEVMMGHVRECLTHYFNVLNLQSGSRESTAKKTPLAEFCGVDVQSVTKWHSNEEILPRGEVLIKLMCFLDLMGYRVIKLEGMPKLSRCLAEIIGFGLVTAKELSILLGFTFNKAECHLYRFLLKGDLRISEYIKQRAFEIWKERRDDLEIKKEEAEEKYYWEFASQTSSTPTTLIPTTLAIQTRKLDNDEIPPTPSSAVIHFMVGLLGLLEGGSLEFLKSNLKDLNQADMQVILKLSGCLGALSSQIMLLQSQKGVSSCEK